MTIRLYVFLCVTLLSVCYCTSEAVVKNGAYIGLKVAFSKDLPRNDTDFVDKVKNVLERTSSVLREAIGIRIGSVQLYLPDSWDSLEGDIGVGVPLGDDVDVLVNDQPLSTFGTLQYGGCGVKGRHITLTSDWLLSGHSYPAEKELAREWMKYRYGVFDENGFANDRLYPLFYTIPGTSDVKVTDCTDPEVKYVFRDAAGEDCEQSSSDCLNYPDEESGSNVTSSLMYFHRNLTDMTSVCGRNGHVHNDASPNKHNALCRGRSIFEVMRTSLDFKSNLDVNDDDSTILFEYVREQKPRVIFAWQKTIHLQKKEDLIRYMAHRLLFSLPEGAKLGLFDYNSPDDYGEHTTWILPYGELTPASRAQSFLIKYHNPATPCVTCLLKYAAQVLRDDGSNNSTLVIIAAHNPKENEEISSAVAGLKDSGTCLWVIGTQNATEEGFRKLVSASPCGKFQKMQDDAKDDFDTISGVLATLTPLPEYTEQVMTGTLTYDLPMVIPFQGVAESFTLWTVQYFDNLNCFRVSDGEKWNVKITKLNGINYYTFLAAEGDVECKLEFDTIAPSPTQVLMTTKREHHVTGTLWVHEATTQKDEIQGPVILYASVTMGGLNVLGAEVQAEITSPSGEVFNITLYDDGRGDPDVTMSDGVYSRYFTLITEPGTYAVTVTAASTADSVTTKSDPDASRCCGSVVPTPHTQDTPSFKIPFGGTFIAKSAKPEAGYRPGRITDLRVEKSDWDHFVLNWTAPGAEMDHGTATNYTLLAYTNRNNALNSKGEPSPQAIDVSIQPQVSGTEESFEANLEALLHNQAYFLVLKAINERQQESEVSNILTVFLSETSPTSDPDTSTSGDDQLGRKASLPKETVAIIIGVLLSVLVLVIVIYLVVYFCFIKPKQRNKGENLQQEQSTDSRRHVSLNSIPADVILKHHNEVLTAKKEHRAPPIFREDQLETPQSNGAQVDRHSTHSIDDDQDYNHMRTKAEIPNNPVPKSPKRITPV